jgi:TonB-dependent starch-binding outer membrane protein SusC
MKQILPIRFHMKRCRDLFRYSFMVLMLLSSAVNAQNANTVRGKVTDETGTEMPGVNIVIKGTTNGTTTDQNGDFSISVPNNDAVLTFSFIGYASQDVALGGRTSIEVKMATDVLSLSEVVVVGYGTQKKSDVTGSLVRVDEKALKEIPVANIIQALQGRAAGVEINPTSSRPGGGGQIRIRGNRSFTGSNDPLIVLDGIPFSGTINDVNPSDITSMDILKDASATAIYGSRGSNGVIIITTKRGQAGRPQFTYDGYYGFSSAIDQYRLYNGEEYLAFRNAAREPRAWGGAASYTETPDELVNAAAGNDTDWQKETYRTGYITNHSIGASGGTETTKYLISAGYFKQTTILPGQEFTRYSLQGSIDQEIGKHVKVGLNTMNSMNVTDGEGANFMFQLLTLSPLYNVRNADGTLYEKPATGSIDPDTRNPLLVYNEDSWKQQRRRLRTFNSLYGEVKILEGLRYRLNIGLDLFQDNYGQFLGSNTPFVNGGTNGADVQNTNSWSYTAENLLIYEKTFASAHKVLFTGLFSVQEEEEYRSASTAGTLPADAMYYYNLGLGLTSSVPLTNSYYRKSGLASYMGRINYSFKDRYLVTLTARADGSSRLAEGNKWFYYPAAALGWNIHNEQFMSSIGAVSNLKLRVGIGTVSNQSIAPYASLGRLAGVDGRPAEPYNFGGTGTFGYLVTELPNPVLTWEFTTTSNLGLDFGLLSDRITGSLELYQQKTKDILQRVSLPQTTGVGGVVQNVGSSENKGIELSLSSVNIESESKGFGWSTDFNFFVNRNKITYLAGGVNRNIGSGWHVGYPIDAIFDYEKIGIVQLEDTGLPAGFDPGEIKIKDQLTVDSDGDGIFDQANGVINGDDRIILGSTQPKWSGGLTNRFTFKGLDLSVVMFWRVGGMLVSNLYGANPANPINSLEGRRSGPKVDFWTPTNPTNRYPYPGKQPDYGSTLGYFDATYMKIRTITLGYNLPGSWLGKTGLSSVRLYAQLQNPFKAFFSDYVKEGGVDPETNGFGGSNTEGFGPNGTNRLTVSPNTPPTKSFIFGLNLKF